MPGRDLEARKDLRDMVSVANLYYKENLSQREIGERLHLSVSKVSRLLARATKEIVTVTITPPRLIALEQELKKRFKFLSDVIVIPEGEKPKSNLGPTGAKYLEALMRGKEVVRITIACGETLYSVVENLDPGELTGQTQLYIYPMNVSDITEQLAIFPTTLVAIMAAKYFRVWGVDNIHAYTPQIPEIIHEMGKQERTTLLENYGISSVLKEAESADIFLLGIGTGKKNRRFSQVLERHKIDMEKIKNNVVGEINYQPFDRHGRFIQEVCDKVIGVSVDSLKANSRKIGKYVVAIAGGEEKIEPISISLRNGPYYNCLITDERAAEGVLEIEKQRWV